MFETQFNTPLDETTFEQWLIAGRESKLGYLYVLVLWNATEQSYRPIYASSREELQRHLAEPNESIVAAYDIYSESRIMLEN